MEGRYIRVTALILLLALFCPEVYAFEVSKTSSGLDIKWSSPLATYYINPTSGPSGSVSAITAAMQTWTDVETSNFSFVYNGITNSTAHGIYDEMNIVTFAPMGNNGTLAVNKFWYLSTTGNIVDSDIQFNTDYLWGTNGLSGVYDLQSVATHESGHSLSLADLYNIADSEKTMYGYASSGETKKRTLDQDDIEGISYLYPGSCTDLYEPNDSLTSAYGPITSGLNYNGKICSGSDVDWFAVDIPSAGTISISLAVSPSNDYDIGLYNPSGILIANSNNGPGAEESITYNVAAGTYYIRISGYRGSYNTAAPYILSYTFNPYAASLVVVSGSRILVNGNPFTARGVVYSPVPVGDDPETTHPFGDYFTSDYSAIYDRDLSLIRQMGANTMRIWTWGNTANHIDFLDKAYSAGNNPIYIIAGFWINAGLDIDPDSPGNVREQLKSDFRDMVAMHKNHPAILMWAIGNELNSDWMYGGNPDHLFSLINEMAAEAHAEEGSAHHPVTTALYDSDLIQTINYYDPSMTDLDVWGANIYRGYTFGALFDEYRAASQKPFVVLEYGIDAYDNNYGMEYEKHNMPYQAEYAEALWNELASNPDVCIGGTIMAYSDEWWRGKYSSDAGCPDSDPAVHSACGYPASSHPDGYANDEWWGIMRTVYNPSGPDSMEPRAAYRSLKAIWTSSAPMFRLTVSRSGPGSGTVRTRSRSEITCGYDCAETYITGRNATRVTLQAIADPGSTFRGWSGDCAGTRSICVLIMDAEKNAVAIFSLPDLSGSWSGILISQRRTGYLVSGMLTVYAGEGNTGIVYADIYLSDDPVLDANDILLTTTPIRIGKIRADRMMSRRLRFQLTDNPSGKYLIAVIDPDGSINETDKGNNIAVTALP
ncbi:MAG: matrixin family metalloprotease [Nitrospirota bacterium]